MKVYTLFLLLLFPPCILCSQKTVPAFGEIDEADLKMTSCSFEKDANALKLFDVQETEYEFSAFGGHIRTSKRVRIKIFSEKGYEAAAIRIPYYSNKKNTKIELLQGIVYSLDASGKINIQKLQESDFFTEKAAEKVGLISFTFPGLKPGCVIEYNYELSEKNRLEIDTWLIQSDIPSLYSAMTVTIPAFSEIRNILFGFDSISRKKEILTKGLDKEKNTFFKENIPSFKPEPFMTSYYDNIIRMGFVLLKDKSVLAQSFSPQTLWRMAANLLLKSGYFDEQFRKVIPGTEKYIDTALMFLKKEDRLKYLYGVIKNRIPGKSGQAAYTDNITDTWKKRVGTSAEINLLFLNLLKRSNVTCQPVFVSTRDHGKINIDFPNFGQFNGLDVLVTTEDATFLVDASQKFQSYAIPPLNILNRTAFVMDPDNIRWVSITDDRPLLKQTTDIFATLTKDGKIEAGASLMYFDYAKTIALDSSFYTKENNNGKFFDKDLSGMKIIVNEKDNIDNNEPLYERIEFDYEVPNSGNFFFIKPQDFSMNKKNPFTADMRLTDIDLGCNQEFRITMQLDIPNSFQVEHMPENIVVKSPDGNLVFSRVISANQSKISYSQVMEIKKSLFDKTEYPTLFDFYKQAQKIASEEIILKQLQ